VPEEVSNQRYCTNCGAGIRPSTKFCVSCGASLVPSSAPEKATAHVRAPLKAASEAPQSQPERRVGSFGASQRSPASRVNLEEISNRILNWFRDLPSVPKLVLVGLIVLLLALLSPLALVVATLALGVSILGLVIRMAQKRSTKTWGIGSHGPRLSNSRRISSLSRSQREGGSPAWW
jgi:hypothetical protein